MAYSLVGTVITLGSALFTEWTDMHNKSYGSAPEYAHRASVFEANLARIHRHNLEADAGKHTWRMAMNEFGDYTAEEFKLAVVGGGRYTPSRSAFRPRLLDVRALPTAIDWVSKGAVTPVKNQGQCGSCWAFSTTGAVEGAFFVANRTLVSLSEQQLVDCSSAYGNMGCNGGLMDNAFEYIIANKGITSEANYPYTAADGTCNAAAASKRAAQISSYVDVTPNSDADLMAALARQPVSVAIEADQSAFQFYSSGVLTAACGTALDHGVLAVGYGHDSAGGDYYKVKNSWGTGWGEGGYVRLGRGPQYNGGAGQCGILSVPSYPVV
jgi:cathepsin L